MNISKLEMKIDLVRYCRNVLRGPFQAAVFNPKMSWGAPMPFGTPYKEREALCQALVKDGLFIDHRDGTYGLKRKLHARIYRFCLFTLASLVLKMGAFEFASSLLKIGKRL